MLRYYKTLVIYTITLYMLCSWSILYVYHLFFVNKEMFKQREYQRIEKWAIQPLKSQVAFVFGRMLNVNAFALETYQPQLGFPFGDSFVGSCLGKGWQHEQWYYTMTCTSQHGGQLGEYKLRGYHVCWPHGHDLWPMTLTFRVSLDLVMVHEPTNFFGPGSDGSNFF